MVSYSFIFWKGELKMKEIKNIYGMPKKSWKRFCDSKNTIKQRRENKEARKNRFKKDNT